MHAPHPVQRSPPCAVRSWAPSSRFYLLGIGYRPPALHADERTNRHTTTTQPRGRSRRRAGTPWVREGGPPCRRRSPIAPLPRSPALIHLLRHRRRSQRHHRPIPKLTPISDCHFTSPPPHRRRAGPASERYAISLDDLTNPPLARPCRDSGTPCSRV